MRGDNDGVGVAPEPDPADRFSFFESTLSLLRAAAERQPLALIIEDLHAADEGTLLATRFVARQLADARILLVVTARPRPADAASTLAARAELEQSATVVTLGGLDGAEVAALVRADGGPPNRPPSRSCASSREATPWPCGPSCGERPRDR